MIIQVTIERSCHNRHIGMGLFHAGNPLGRGQQAQKPDVLGSLRLQQINRRRAGVARGLRLSRGGRRRTRLRPATRMPLRMRGASIR